MRRQSVLGCVLLIAGTCYSCSTSNKHVVPAETVAAMAEPGSPASKWTGLDVTEIPSQELEALQMQSGKRFEGERVMFLRLRARDGSPLAYANVACPASRVGVIADEGGIAWLHGMTADTVEVRVVALVKGSSVRTGFVAIVSADSPIGFEIRVPKGVPTVAEP